MTNHSDTGYVAMAGLHGCMPAICDWYQEYDDAVDALVYAHELGKHRRSILHRDGYLELSIARDGNEYCEITISDEIPDDVLDDDDYCC